jgi:hypothetical protein
MRVREADATDAAAIGAVHVSSWEGTYRGMVPDEACDERTLARRTAMRQEILGPVGEPVDGQRPWACVAVRDGTPIGFASLNIPSRDDGAGPRTGEISASTSSRPRGVRAPARR